MSLGTDHMFDDDMRGEGADETGITEEDEELEDETEDEEGSDEGEG